MLQKVLTTAIITVTLSMFLFYYIGNNSKAESTEVSNVYEKLETKQTINYLIIGDSIGRSSGASSKSSTWFKQFEKLMKKEYGNKLVRFPIVQSGATTFEGIYKFQEYSKHPSIDMAFIIFGENDRKYMDSTTFGFHYEMLLRKTKKEFPATEIITIIENCLDDNKFAKVIKTISSHYNAKNIDMRYSFQQSGYSKEELTKDSVHPNDLGYKIFANELFHFLNKQMKTKPEIAHLATPLQNNVDMSFKEINKYSAKDPSFIKKDGYLETKSKGAKIQYSFYGTFIGVKLLRSTEGGCIDIYVDGKYNQTISTWWPTCRERIIYITSGLKNGPHHVQFIVTGKKSHNNITNKAIFQIISIIVPNNNYK